MAAQRQYERKPRDFRVPQGGAGSHAGRLEDTEQEQKLRRAIELLPANQKQVLLLRYYSKLKFVEIAEMVGCPLNTALGRMRKAILKLRELMEETLNDER